ncbi:MAG: hypothetical protein M0038_15695 [Pseudomonadota bacterium]|nr:hypothetical protein [Pseudomonadota bacterium]
MSEPGNKPGGMARNAMEPSHGGTKPSAPRQADSTRPSRGGQLVIGRLTEHGRAHYQFRAGEDLSYYLKLLTSQGERVLWGKDLERALTTGETKPKVGDLVGARRVARRAVTITARERDAEGRVVRQQEQHAHRTRWVVEKVKFFAERARLARQLREEQLDVRESVRAHPELKSTFLSIRAAETFADQRIADPKDRERFLELVRGAMAGSIQKGAPLPSVKLRDSRTRSDTMPIKGPAPKREEPTR